MDLAPTATENIREEDAERSDLPKSLGYAATRGQQNTLNMQTTNDPEMLKLADSANVPSTFLATELTGGRPLEPETSVSTTAGGVIYTGYSR